MHPCNDDQRSPLVLVFQETTTVTVFIIGWLLLITSQFFRSYL